MSALKIGSKVIFKEAFTNVDELMFTVGEVYIITGMDDTLDDPKIILNGMENNYVTKCQVESVESIKKLVKESIEKIASESEAFDIPYEEPKKYNDNKPMMSLIRPEFQLGLASALTYGAKKYSENRGDTPNYLQGGGFHYTTIIDSLERHLNAFKRGVRIDEESELDHLSLIAANLMFLHTYENSDKGIDDIVVLTKDVK